MDKPSSKLRVAVLMGGTSSEREISLSTGRQIMAALDPQKYQPVALDAAALSGKAVQAAPAVRLAGSAGDSPAAPTSTEMVPVDLAQIASEDSSGRPDVVFIALHGKGGEDGTVQGMLELLGIPYTGSGVLASALAMDKSMAKRVLKAEGIPVPAEILLKRGRRPESSEVAARVESEIGYPVIVKPNAQGSTIGCTIVRASEELDAAMDAAFSCDDAVLIEQLVGGIEITVGLLGNDEPEVLPIIEIVAKGGFYDFESKYAQGGSEHVIPARISEAAAAKAREYAARSHVALGCQGMSRVDMMVEGDDPVVLEVNTIPGMTPTSLLPDAARAAGISFGELLDRLIGYAVQRSQ